MTASDETESDKPVALLDACTLIPIRLTSALLWLAEAGLFEVLWSEAILDEVERNLPKMGVTPEQATRRVATMREGFGAAALVDDFEHLIPEMTCHVKDRHVLAAAVRGGADTLVTFNLKDFPSKSTAAHGIEAIHPDMFLTRLLTERTDEVVSAVARGTATLRRPLQTARQFLASLTRTVPVFANLTADAAVSPHGPTSSIPALVGTDPAETLAMFGEPGDLTNPAQVAAMWWAGILGDLDLAKALTYDPAAWGDFQSTTDLLTVKALASKVIRAVDAPHDLAFMRFMPEIAATAQVIAAFVAPMTFLTLVRLKDGTWRVWGLGGGTPAARDVLGEDFQVGHPFGSGGGTGLVFEWLTQVAEPNPPVELIWGSLDDPLRLANAQSWLLETGDIEPDDPKRNAEAAELATRDSTHPLFDRFYDWLVAHYHHVYRDVDGKPCLVEITEAVGLDMELVVFTSEAVVGEYEPGAQISGHAFITRHVGDGQWVIAANARRLPVPGWPPTEQELPGLLIDGS